jgi:hypothetical protein
MYKKLTATLFKKAVPARYDHINFTPPKGVREEAKRGLKLRREHKRGGLSTQQASKHGIGSGVQRATNLASGARVSPRTVRRMRAFFARHSAYKEHHKDRTSASYISWLLWGGDAGERWANKVYAQMERADDEMKKAGGEQAGHKYLRRIPVARRGKMGYRYIYRRDKKRRKDLRRKDGGAKTTIDEGRPTTIDEGRPTTIDEGRPTTIDEGRPTTIDEGRPTTIDEGRPTTVDEGRPTTIDEGRPTTVDEGRPTTIDEAPPTVLGEDSPPPLTDTWEEADIADIMALAPELHTPTFDGLASASVELDENPIEGAPAEDLTAFKEALSSIEALGPMSDAVNNTVSVDGEGVRLPLKDIGKATALSLMLIATESYRTLTTGDPNAVSVAEIEGFSKRELNRMDREAVKEAKDKLRESLNKDREEARTKKEEARKEERTRKEQSKQERADQITRDKMEAKKQREEDRAEVARLKELKQEKKKQEKEEENQRKKEEAEKRAEREFEFRREERERAQQAKEEAQIRKEERAEKRRLARKKVPKKQAKKALTSATDEHMALPRRVRRTKLRKSLVTMYTGRGSDETTS